jgi:mannan endo-1,4-beta-mannosidase
MQYAADPEKHPISAQGLENADVKNRGDGVDKLDAAEIQKYAAGIISKFN